MISGGITPPIMKELPLTEKGAMLTEVVIMEPTGHYSRYSPSNTDYRGPGNIKLRTF